MDNKHPLWIKSWLPKFFRVRTVIRALTLLRLDGNVLAPQVAAILELTGHGVRQIAQRYGDGLLGGAWTFILV